MLKRIFHAASHNVRRFVYIWLSVLIINQIFIFRACFAPYCLAAALPHTLAIALLLNFLLRKGADGSGDRADANAGAVPKTAIEVSMQSLSSNGEDSRQSKRLIRYVFPFVLGAFAAAGSIFLIAPDFLERHGEEATAGQASSAGDMAVSGVGQEAAHHGGSVADSAGPAILPNYEDIWRAGADLDDEFDDNDIEDFERLTGRSYSNRFHLEIERTRDAKYVAGAGQEEMQKITAEEGINRIRNSSVDTDLGAREYKCADSAGKTGTGTGRSSQEGEYSAFLKRGVHAGEFFVFRYEDSGREYWFRPSRCQLL